MKDQDLVTVRLPAPDIRCIEWMIHRGECRNPVKDPTTDLADPAREFCDVHFRTRRDSAVNDLTAAIKEAQKYGLEFKLEMTTRTEVLA